MKTFWIILTAGASLHAAQPATECLIGANAQRYDVITQQGLDLFRESAGKDFSVYMFYNHFDNLWPATPIQLAIVNKKIPHMKFSPKNGDHPGGAVYQAIADGHYDTSFAYIGDQIADWITSNDRSFWFDFAHEMNGSWKEFLVTDWGTSNGPVLPP